MSLQLRNLCYNNRENLSAGILVADGDKREGGQVGCCNSETCVITTEKISPRGYWWQTGTREKVDR